MSEVVIHRRVARYLDQLSYQDRMRIRTVLVRLAEDPMGYPGLVVMVGEWTGYYRIHVGDLRIIFWYDRESDTVYVDHVGPRGDIYKQ